MYRNTQLKNGSTIHTDIIDTFDKAIVSDQNVAQGVGTTDFWNYVEADMFLALASVYSTEYLMECFNTLADSFMECWNVMEA